MKVTAGWIAARSDLPHVRLKTIFGWGALCLRHWPLVSHQYIEETQPGVLMRNHGPRAAPSAPIAAEITMIKMDFPFLPVLSEAFNSRAIEDSAEL